MYSNRSKIIASRGLGMTANSRIPEPSVPTTYYS